MPLHAGPRTRPSFPPAAAGDRLLHYRLLELIGAGGMGIVWRALDTHLVRDVALKLLPVEESSDDPDRLDRFIREARSASVLTHPNIVTIHDVNSDRGIHFIVMEYVRGHSLRAVLRDRSLARHEVLRFAIQIADGVGRAHQAGVIHRDIKPANVMISDDGSAKVVDFGLAKRVPAGEADSDPVANAETSITSSVHAGLGTPGYMSPEQVVGQAADARSDVFAFGALLYEMDRRHPAFAGGSRTDAMQRVLAAEPPGLNNRDALDVLIRRCLRKDATERFANCVDVASALRAVASRPARGSRLRDWRVAAVTMTAIAALALVLTAVRYVASGSWLPWTTTIQRGVAVLPFTSIGSSPRTDAYATGLTMATATYLSEIEDFQQAFWVVPAADVLQAGVSSVRDARQVFNVDLVVNGTVETSDARLRVTTVVSDARTLRQMRSRQVTREAGDSLVLQDELVRMVGELLTVELPIEARAAIRSDTSTEPAAQDFYLQGLGYLQQPEQVDSAIEVLIRALERDPQFAAAHAGLAAAYLEKFDATKAPSWIHAAKASTKRALELRAALPEGLIVLGNIARVEGRYPDAVEQLLRVVEVNPRSRDGWLRLAQAYEAAQQPQRAEDAYRKAIAIAPGNPRSHQALGLFFYRQGRYREAETAFAGARDLAPDNYHAYQQLGTVYLQTNRYREAEEMFKRSIAIRPTPNAYNNLGASYFYERRYAEAVPVLEKALQYGSLTPALLGNLARMYRLTPPLAARAPAAYQRAFELANTMLEVNPRDAEIHADIAWLRAELGDRAVALRHITTARAIAPSSGSVLFRAVLVYEILGDRAAALEACRALARTGSLADEIRRRPELEALQSDPAFKEIPWPITPSR